MVDWDGESDLVQVSHWILEDGGTHPDQDEVFKRAQKEALLPKFIANFYLRYSNRYTNKLREKDKQIRHMSLISPFYLVTSVGTV